MPGSSSDADLAKMHDVCVQLIVGEKDSYWKNGSERWHRQMLDQGIHSTIEIIPNGEHVMPKLIGEIESGANRRATCHRELCARELLAPTTTP